MDAASACCCPPWPDIKLHIPLNGTPLVLATWRTKPDRPWYWDWSCQRWFKHNPNLLVIRVLMARSRPSPCTHLQVRFWVLMTPDGWGQIDEFALANQITHATVKPRWGIRLCQLLTCNHLWGFFFINLPGEDLLTTCKTSGSTCHFPFKRVLERPPEMRSLSPGSVEIRR